MQITNNKLNIFVRNSTNQILHYTKGFKIPNLFSKCVQHNSGIDNLVKNHLSPVSAAKLTLSEPALFSSSPTGPWKVQLPKMFQTYHIHQSPEEVFKYGKISQDTIISNHLSIGFITMKPTSISKIIMVPAETPIGSIDFVQDVKQSPCMQNFSLIASKDVVCPPMKNIGIPVEADISTVCQEEFHAINIEPCIPYFLINTKDLKRYVIQEHNIIYFKTPIGNSVKISKGDQVAIAQCCHGHYEDSMHY